MRIILNSPLKIDVSEIACFFPEFAHRKPFMGTFGFIDSEVIRNDRSRDKSCVMFFDSRSEQGFSEIRSDHDNLDELKYVLSRLSSPLREKLFSAFDDADILLRPYELPDMHWREYLERMSSAKRLEQRLNPTLKSYQGKMTSTANTDVQNRIIHLDISQPSLKVALSYVYELKNLENATRYLKLTGDARKKQVFKGEFICAVLTLEAEAIYFRSQAFRELNIPDHFFPCKKVYLTLYDKTSRLPIPQAVDIIARHTRETGHVKRDHSAKKYYSDFFKVLLGKKESLSSYNVLPDRPTIILLDHVTHR
jgi:hypothetical protein